MNLDLIQLIWIPQSLLNTTTPAMLIVHLKCPLTHNLCITCCISEKAKGRGGRVKAGHSLRNKLTHVHAPTHTQCIQYLLQTANRHHMNTHRQSN